MKIQWKKIPKMTKVLFIVVIMCVVTVLILIACEDRFKGIGIDQHIYLLNTIYKGKIIDIKNYGGGTQKGIELDPPTEYAEKTKLIIVASTSALVKGEEWILTQSSYCNAHVCGAELGGAILSYKDGKFTVKKVEKDIDRLGESGRFNLPQLISIGSGTLAFQINDSHGNHGHFESKLLLYTVIDGEFRKILDIPRAFVHGGENIDDSGAGYYGYETYIRITPVPNSKYYDLTAEIVGTDKINGQIVSIKKINRYAFDGMKYVLK